MRAGLALGPLALLGGCFTVTADDVSERLGHFVQLSVGPNASGCAVDDAGRIGCWGSYRGLGDTPWNAPSAEDPVYRQVDVGRDRVCATYWDEAFTGALNVHCWGAEELEDPGEADHPAMEVHVGGSHACAVLDDAEPDEIAGGGIHCWGAGEAADDGMPSFAFSVAVGAAHGCAGIPLSDGDEVFPGIRCWGTNAGGRAPVEVARVTEVVAGDAFTCARDDDSDLVCWGESPLRGSARHLSLTSLIAAGGDATCVTNPDVITCARFLGYTADISWEFGLRPLAIAAWDDAVCWITPEASFVEARGGVACAIWTAHEGGFEYTGFRPFVEAIPTW